MRRRRYAPTNHTRFGYCVFASSSRPQDTRSAVPSQSPVLGTAGACCGRVVTSLLRCCKRVVSVLSRRTDVGSAKDLRRICVGSSAFCQVWTGVKMGRLTLGERWCLLEQLEMTTTSTISLRGQRADGQKSMWHRCVDRTGVVGGKF